MLRIKGSRISRVEKSIISRKLRKNGKDDRFTVMPSDAKGLSRHEKARGVFGLR